MIRTKLIAICLLALLLAAPASAQTFRLGGTSLPHGLGNPFTAAGAPSSTVWHALFDTLVRFEADGSMVPGLALDWELESDTRWVFRLRPDVTFANGEMFDAAAVKATLDYLLSEDGKAEIVAAEVANIARVEVIDPLTIAVETREPDAILANRLGLIYIVAPGAWAELGPAGFAQRPVGTGPFVLESWGSGTGRATMRANPQSWRAPQIDEVQVIELADVTGRVQALISGQVDAAVGLGPDEVRILRRAGFASSARSSGQVLSWAFRTVGNPDSPFNDVRVRKALNYAVDKQAIATGILYNTVRPASQGSGQEIFGYNPELEAYPYDPEKARALLAEAGYPDGFSVEAEVMTNLAPADALIYQRTAQDLAKVGVDVELQATVFPAWVRKYASGQWGDIDLFSITWNTTAYFDVSRPMEYFSCLKPNPYFCEESLVPLIERAAREMDKPAREALIRALQREVHDQAVALFLVELALYFAHSEAVEGFRLTGNAIAYDEITMR